jgi:hypothetical protein
MHKQDDGQVEGLYIGWESQISGYAHPVARRISNGLAFAEPGLAKLGIARRDETQRALAQIESIIGAAVQRLLDLNNEARAILRPTYNSECAAFGKRCAKRIMRGAQIRLEIVLLALDCNPSDADNFTGPWVDQGRLDVEVTDLAQQGHLAVRSIDGVERGKAGVARFKSSETAIWKQTYDRNGVAEARDVFEQKPRCFFVVCE